MPAAEGKPFELVVDCGILVVAGLLLVISADYPPTARDFPQMVLVLVLVLGGANLVRQLLHRRKGDAASPEDAEAPATRGYGRVLTMAALMVACLALLLLLGFSVGTLVFLVGAGWVLGYRKPVPLLLSSVIITGLMYAMFVWLMNSLLPSGLLLHLL